MGFREYLTLGVIIPPGNGSINFEEQWFVQDVTDCPGLLKLMKPMSVGKSLENAVGVLKVKLWSVLPWRIKAEKELGELDSGTSKTHREIV